MVQTGSGTVRAPPFGGFPAETLPLAEGDPGLDWERLHASCLTCDELRTLLQELEV